MALKQVLISIDFVHYGQLPGAQARSNSINAKHLDKVEQDARGIKIFKGKKMRHYPWERIHGMNYDLVDDAVEAAAQ